jgi:hypothetical protein
MPLPVILEAYMEKSPRTTGMANARVAAEQMVLIFMVARTCERGSRSE